MYTDTLFDATFSPDGRTVLAGSGNGTAIVWDSQTGHPLHFLRGQTGNVYNVAFSPDGKTIATASDDHTVILWDARSGVLLHTLRGHEGAVWNLAFSPDGKTVLTASDDYTARLWRVQTGQLLYTLQGETNYFGSIVISKIIFRICGSSAGLMNLLPKQVKAMQNGEKNPISDYFHRQVWLNSHSNRIYLDYKLTISITPTTSSPFSRIV